MAHNIRILRTNLLVYLVSILVFSGTLVGKEFKVKTNEEAQIRAKLYLGEMLATDEGCEKNEAEAQGYFEKVAEQNLDKRAAFWACVWLGKLCYERIDDEKVGAEIKVKDNVGNTALHIAAKIEAGGEIKTHIIR